MNMAERIRQEARLIMLRELAGQANAYLEDISDDFVLLEVSDASNRFGLLWLPTDDTPYAAKINDNHTSYGFYDFSVTASGTHCGSTSYASGPGLFYSYFSVIWSYNPATDRRLPNTNAGAIPETIRSTQSTPKTFIKVK